MRRRLVLGALCLAGVCLATPAGAQSSMARRALPRVEVGVGLRVGAPITFGESSANLVTPDGRPLALFTTSNSLGLDAGLDAQFSVRVTRALAVQISAGWTRPTLRMAIASDFENGELATLTNQLSRLTLEGGILYHFNPASRTVWFLRGTVGSSRGLTSDNVLATQGTVSTIGGGLKHWWPGAPKPRARLGMALEARAVARWKGIVLDQGDRHVSAAAAASALVGF